MKSLSKIFNLHDSASPEVIELLKSATLGTNGARYRHLDTEEKIIEADSPLYLSIIRNHKAIANITFCLRNEHVYLRYFAFDKAFQTKQSSNRINKPKGLTNEIVEVMDSILEEGIEGRLFTSLYAYIDSRNTRSLNFSKSMGFIESGNVITQTFSRVKPTGEHRIEKCENWSIVEPLLRAAHGSTEYFFTAQSSKPPFYVIRDENSEIIACCKVNRARWKIERLPGRLGGVLVKLIPWIPFLRKIIRPSDHQFIVPDSLYVKDNATDVLNQLFEGILHEEGLNLIIWWVYEKDNLYTATAHKMRWGVMDKLIGRTKGKVVVKGKRATDENGILKSHFTAGYDFI